MFKRRKTEVFLILHHCAINSLISVTPGLVSHWVTPLLTPRHDYIKQKKQGWFYSRGYILNIKILYIPHSKISVASFDSYFHLLLIRCFTRIRSSFFVSWSLIQKLKSWLLEDARLIQLSWRSYLKIARLQSLSKKGRPVGTNHEEILMFFYHPIALL